LITRLRVVRGPAVRVGNAIYQRLWILWTRTPLHRLGNAAIERLPLGTRSWIKRRKRAARAWQAGLRLRLLTGQEGHLVPALKLEESYRKALRLLTNDTAGGAVGDYLEFGVYIGTSLLCMHRASRAVGLPSLRLFGFDSFQGLPEEAAAEEGLGFQPGQFRAEYGVVHEHLTGRGIDWDRTVLVPGWYEDTLRPDLAQRLAIGKAGVIMIDCDIYSSARAALAFCAPLIRDRTVIFFDDWPGDGPESKELGERRAFTEFLDENPDLVAQELEPYHEKGKSFLVARATQGRRNQGSARTSRPTQAPGG
jgi:O-methyltransferase